jgi:HAE1 family hydrophobic/amphiphilic exporter-1
MDATIDATLTPVVVEPAQPVASADEIEKLVVPSPRGSVALSEIAEVRYRDAPLVLQRSNGLDSGSVFVTLSGADIGGGAAAIAEVIDGLSLPTGTVSEVAGVAKDQSRAFTQLMFALGASVLIVYVIMVAAFRSLLQPLVLLVSVPFAVTGVIVAQRLWGGALGVSALIGALMLVGIAVTNAIVLVDRFNQLRAEGVSPDEAAVEGATARMRPVVMTAAATVLALGPMALGITGHGGLVAQPLAIVVIGGMASSTALTLMVLPALLSRAEALRSAGPGETRFSSGRHRVSPRRRRALVRRACFIYRGRGPDDSQKATGWRMRTAAGEYDLFLLHGAVLEESTVGMRISHREARRMLGVRFEEALGLMRGISVPVTPEKSAGARSHMQPVESGGQAPRQSSPDRAFADIEFVSDQSGQAIWAVLRETPVPQVEPSNFDEAAEEPERPGQSELLLRYEQESRHGLLFRLEGNEPILSMAPALVGRAPAEAAGYSAVHLPSPEKVVSRTHLLVEADALGRLCITDLDSANGTWADGRQLLPHLPTILPSGADIQIGESRMRVEVLAAAPSRAV